MASIDIEIVGSAVGEKYRVTWRVTSATGMPEEVFLHAFATMGFSGVITASELTYPTTRTNGQAYYRQSEASADYDTLTDAEDAKTNVAATLQDLVDAYNAGLASFLGTTTDSFS